jgi:hypothetical protein
MIGFLAQDLEQYFPQLVGTNEQGQKSVNYANMTPVLVEAIRELNVKLANIQQVANTVDVTFLDNLSSWLGDMNNKLTRVHVDQEVCIGNTCINESDLQQFKQWQTSQGITLTPTGGSSNPETGTSPDSSSGVTSTTSTSPGAPSPDISATTTTDSIIVDPEPVVPVLDIPTSTDPVNETE